MRILLVSHLYPPGHAGGTELYTAELAAQLVRAGHEVRVLASEKDVSRTNLSMHERTHEGILVHELVNNLYYEGFRETWRWPRIDALFGALLDRWRPDVVHFQHLMYLSAGCLEEAARRSLAVVYTLHDFWFECPRFGQLVHADGGICERVVLERCGTCLGSFEWRQSTLARRTGRVLAALRAASGVDLAPAARKLASRFDREAPPVDSAHAGAFAELAGERARDLRSTIARTVDRLVSPSRFLAERAIAFGLDRSRMRVAPTGIDRSRFAPRARRRGERLAIRFFGTLVPLKGAHVLLEAWSRLGAEERARGDLTLFGSQSHAPHYQAQLETLARAAGARLGGRLDREALARELAAADVCVVPSLWFENRPLIALEALATQTPLLVSDLGGLAELVENGIAGWRFPVGDAQALAARLRTLLMEPQALDALHARAVEVPSFDETAAVMIALYEEVLAEKRA